VARGGALGGTVPGRGWPDRAAYVRRLRPDLFDPGGARLVAVLPDRGVHGSFLRLQPIIGGQETAVRGWRGLTGREAANGQKAGGKQEFECH